MSPSISWIDHDRFGALLGRAVPAADAGRGPRSKNPSGFPVPPPTLPPPTAGPPVARGSPSGDRQAHAQPVRPSVPDPSWPSAEVEPGAARPGPSAPSARPGSSNPPARPGPSDPSAPSPTKAAGPSLKLPLPIGTVEERAEALLDWLALELAPDVSFVSDGEGLALLARGASLEDLAVCAALMGALDQVESLVPIDHGSVAIRLGGERVLSCVVEQTDVGRLAVGLVLGDKPAEDRLDAVSRALRAIFSFKENAP